ncbi:MAG TPA: hypothetical protein VGN07_14435 [Steroidobacteraceae bacterium]
MLLRVRSFAHSSAKRALLASAMAAVVTLAHADITIDENVSVSGAGLMKMANMSGHSVTIISGNHARIDSDLQFESGMMRALARGAGANTEIVKLDEDKIYELNQKKKSYTETTLTQRREQMQASMQKMQESQAAQQKATSGVDESECQWSDPKAEVKRSGEKATIGGYQAERLTINATQACSNKKTGEVCEFGLALDQWIAPGFEASEERLAYQRAYAEKLGLTTTSSRDFSERAQSLFGRYKDLWTAVAAQMKDVKGAPVKSSFALGVGGPQCQSTQQAQAAGGPAEAPSLGAALGGALGGMFGKKKAEPAPAPSTPPTAAPNGLMSLMTVSTELVSMSRAKVAPQQFEVPADFKKTKD